MRSADQDRLELDRLELEGCDAHGFDAAARRSESSQIQPQIGDQPARLLSTDELSILITSPSSTRRYAVRSTETLPSVKV